MTTELPAPEDLLKARDRAPVLYVPAQTWLCLYCPTEGGDGAGTTVEWLDGPHDGPDGRCRECGQSYSLARMGEHVPTPVEQALGRANDLEKGRT